MELEQLRRMQDIVRLGRVSSITEDTIYLDEGQIPTDLNTLHIDCSADGLERRAPEAVFADNKITLQSVRTCQQVFSAAFIGHVEASYSDVAIKNELCTPVPHPDTDVDFLRTSLANSLNAARWAKEPELTRWLANARLDGFSQPGPSPEEMDDESKTRLETLATTSQQAVENTQRILETLS